MIDVRRAAPTDTDLQLLVRQPTSSMQACILAVA